jgi:hypothetical protein
MASNLYRNLTSRLDTISVSYGNGPTITTVAYLSIPALIMISQLATIHFAK